ncbi:MAG: MerR family DNA-binding transcriptional regulator [Coriobacteriales bacterium]|jgi:DNA-binding transcriptional MerR regulator|nr:MerR family DNA-binding transcriptional regulator [Coriobacteriales bacterium]
MKHKGLLSIGEFAKLTGISRSKLIYYDEIGLFLAAERGENNYRYYSLNQIILAEFINDMASFGFSLKELQPLVHNRTPELMLDVLQNAIKDHQKQIARLQELQNIMNIRVELMTLGLEAHDADIRVVEYKPNNIVLGNENIYQDAATFYPGWVSFMNAAKKAGLNIGYPVGGYFDSMERFVANPDMPSRYYFVNPRGKTVRGGGSWLVGHVRGFYGDSRDLAQRMLAHAEENGLELSGPVYNTFLFDEVSTNDTSCYLMRASIKIVED